jgi:hypothetical protein
MALQAEQIADLITTTQRDLGKLKWTDIYTPLQEYVALPSILNKEKVSFSSGTGIQWNVMVGNSGAAKNVGLYAEDSTNVTDIMKIANIPWRHSVTSYLFEVRELSMNSDPARIVELIKTRRADAMISLAELMESNFWGKPTDSSDEVTPFGVDYWVVPNSSEGFNGGAATGFTEVAGLNPSTYTNWRNWTAEYAAVTKSDLIRKWRKAATMTNFMSPVAQPQYNTGDRFGYYVNYDTLAALEEILEDQNDSLGNDIASKDGLTLFRGNPVRWVPKLDADATDPVIGINWGVFKPVFLKGEYLRESAPAKAANSHNSMEVFVDLTLNFECRDRRRNFRIQKAS